jgi:anti-sigma regulatory factor (Ser/Thr protein kinase)
MTTSALGVGRRVVRDACLAWDLPQLVDDAELLVTEIVANAVRHAGGPVDLVVTRSVRYLRMAVRDRSHAPPVRTVSDPETSAGGRGLLILDAVAAGWGTADTLNGKVVWATLRIGAPRG